MRASGSAVGRAALAAAFLSALGGAAVGAALAHTTPSPHSASPPSVTSIDRLDPSPTNAASVRWKVTFSESVTGVGGSDFKLVKAGLAGSPAVTGVPRLRRRLHGHRLDRLRCRHAAAGAGRRRLDQGRGRQQARRHRRRQRQFRGPDLRDRQGAAAAAGAEQSPRIRVRRGHSRSPGRRGRTSTRASRALPVPERRDRLLVRLHEPYHRTVSSAGGHAFEAGAVDRVGNVGKDVDFYWTVKQSQSSSFSISGTTSVLLYPGGADVPVDLVFRNPGGSALTVTSMIVTITGTNAGACPAAGNFTVSHQLSQAVGPIPPGTCRPRSPASACRSRPGRSCA